MKKIILLSVCGLLALNSCQKNADVVPPPTQPLTTIVKATPAVTKLDTIPDGAILKIKLQQDSASIDETLLKFEHNAPINYSSAVDAVYFTGFGIGSLASLTANGIPCAIHTLPFVQANATRLKVGASHDGVYLLKISYTSNIPQNMNIWLKDAYKKDSLNLRLWNYSFNVYKADSNSYGSKRFTVVLR